MKKILALVLAMMLVLSMSAVAFADEETTTTYADMSTVTISKTYDATNTGTTSPAETFNFTIEDGAKIGSDETVTYVTDSTVENKDGVILMPQIGNVAYAAGEAGSATKTKNITINLPTYTVVGVYYYTIAETAGKTAGVDYHADPIVLKVTVIQDTTGKIRVAAVHAEKEYTGVTAGKTSAITNVYSAGTVAVTKNVTGNMGDQTKDFTVKVVFTAPDGMTVKEAISYTDDGENKTIAADWSTTTEVTIDLKHAETVTFTNVPYGVTYTVTEDSYTADGYDEAVYTDDDTDDEKDREVDDAADTVTITNNKGTTIDTGISLDNMPYVIIMGLVVLAGAAMLMKKRAYND